jgi:hypothetical protein
VWGAGERRNAHTLKGTSPYFKIWKKEKDVFRDTYVQEIQRPYFETPAFKYGVPYTLHPLHSFGKSAVFIHLTVL